MNAPVHTRKPGDFVCGKWKVERVLRVSPTATTYAAIHRNGASVALKILHRHLASDSELVERFRREAYAANAIQHPGIVKIVDDDTAEDGSPVLVMDLIEGEPLEDLRRAWGGRLPLDVAVDFIGQLLDMVAVAHDLGIVHRDLQPESVVIGPGGRVRLFDFGIAKLRSQPGTEDELTRNGVILGAPPFMAPEQALGRRELVDAQTDIFSVGATLFLLLSGQGLHDAASAPTPLAQIIAASSKKARSLRSVVGEELVPDAVVEVVDRAVAYRKSERWLDARSFATALREACAGSLRAEVHPADDADDPTWTTGPELEPEILASLKAAQGIAPSGAPPPMAPRAPSRPPAPVEPRVSPISAPVSPPISPPISPAMDEPILGPDFAEDPTQPVPDSIVLAARLAGAPIPGTAPIARPFVPSAPAVEPRESAQIPAAPSSRRLVRKVPLSAPRLPAVSEPAAPKPAPPLAPTPTPTPTPTHPELLALEDDQPTGIAMYPPRRGPEISVDEATVIVNATPVPPAMPRPLTMPMPAFPSMATPGPIAVVGPMAEIEIDPMAPMAGFAPPVASFGAPPSAASSQRIAALGSMPGAPPSRRRADDATVLLMPPKPPPTKSSGRLLLVLVLVVSTIALVLLAVNLFMMRR